MFQINEDMTIEVTRGDAIAFSVKATEGVKDYTFKKGDIVRFKVTEKKDCDAVVLQKDFEVTAETVRVDIMLGENETRIGEVISKPTDYWYEVELNPNTNPQTIIGYDEDGAKILKLYPEGRDLEFEPDPEDVGIIDEELSATSERPVQNQAITRELNAHRDSINELTGKLTYLDMTMKSYTREIVYNVVDEVIHEQTIYGRIAYDDKTKLLSIRLEKG